MTTATSQAQHRRAIGESRRFALRVGFYGMVALVALFFALPMAWLILAPFDQVPTLAAEVPEFTLSNFARVLDNRLALRSMVNSLILVVGVVGLVIATGAPTAYVLSRIRFRGREIFLYVLLLFSSVVTGTAAMVPLFLLVFNLGMIDTFTGVVLVLAGGTLPASIFILKDFTDNTPPSYEESARVFGASPIQILRDIVLPVIRPGLAVVSVWVGVNVWGNFLLPFILLRSPSRSPAAVLMYSFYTEGGQADLRLISAFSLLYTVPVLLMYLYVNRRYGFRFFGGLKG
jgi:multiple sugar transport system permease protein